MSQQSFEEALKNRSLKVGVVGLGYVGLPLAVELADGAVEHDVGEAVLLDLERWCSLESTTAGPLVALAARTDATLGSY